MDKIPHEDTTATKFCSDEDIPVEFNSYSIPASGPIDRRRPSAQIDALHSLSNWDLTRSEVLESNFKTQEYQTAFPFVETSQISRETKSIVKGGLCRMFQLGKCRMGDLCRYSHEVKASITAIGIVSPVDMVQHIIGLCNSLPPFKATFKQSYSSLYSFLVPTDIAELQCRVIPIHDLLQKLFLEYPHDFLDFLGQYCDAFRSLQHFQLPLIWKSKTKNLHATVLRKPDTVEMSTSSLQDAQLDIQFSPVSPISALGDPSQYSSLSGTVSPLLCCQQTEGKACLWIALHFSIQEGWCSVIQPGDSYCYRISIVKLDTPMI